jgi:HSP20 family protein
MALPVRLSRGQTADDFARNDFGTMLNRLFTRGLIADVDDISTLAPSVMNYGVDIREDNDHFYVEADLPGFRKEDVDIQLENGTLTIIAERHEEIEVPGDQSRRGQQPEQAGQGQQTGQQGQQRQEKQQQEKQGGRASGEYLLRERRVERFVRSFTLPPNVDERNVQAKLENGVLRITLNKLQESKPKKVEVS